ncbi:MAG TPA: lantibiotic dehydratase, partial [Longimicrobiaceae bacterium]|nr:lantibiotic dehydratase [Longimicrobiaceae bacterium]
MNQQPWQDSAAENDGERLFPRFVCRIGGAPVDGVERLRAPRTLAAAQALADADAELEAGRERVSAILHARIGQVEDDRAARQTLIRARRELFNLHPLADAALDGVCVLLPADDAEALRAFQRALHGRAELARAADEAHMQESAQARAAFRGLVRDEDFRKGLLVSSRSLHAALDRYADSASAVPNAREEKTERGLLRYYTRMAMKATPFATFCAVVAGRFVPAEGDVGDGVDAPVLRLEGSPVPKRSFVRINKLLYGILLDHLKQRPGVRHALAVELNPTLRDEGPRRVFLTSLAGREVFQRLADNEVLHLITQAFRGRPTLGDLIRTLSSDPEIDATPEEAEAYLDKLIEIGFLRFHTGIREQDADWDGPLAELLEAIDDPHAQRSARLLREVRAQTDAYAAASVEQRGPIIAGILAALDEALVEMEVTGRLRRDMPFYEDATADAGAEVALTPGVRRATDTFAEWARITSRLGWPRTEQASMRHFYDTFYAGRAGVPLLVFYEDFYREHFKAHVEKEQKSRAGQRDGLEGYDVGNPFGLEFIRTVNAARNRLQDAIVERWRAAPDAEEIRITMAEVQAALADVEPQPVPCRSVSAFALLAPPSEEGGDPAILLQGGSFTAGYGKYFSRFLYMLPDEFVAEVRESNEELTGELLAEICGDAQFNANLHPPLLRWEISYPTGESGAADEQLRSSDVFVEPDGDDPHSLCLRHGPTGRRVVPVDLGFL